MPTLPIPEHGRLPPSTETQPGTDVHDRPVRTEPVAVTCMTVPKFSWDMKGDDRPDKTLSSGMGTLQSRGPGPVRESLLPDTRIDRGTMGVDASTPILKLNHRLGTRNSVRPRWFGHDLTRIPDAPPQSPSPRMQPGPDLVSQHQVDQSADTQAIIAQLWSEIHTLTFLRIWPPKLSRFGAGQSNPVSQIHEYGSSKVSWGTLLGPV